MSSLEPGSDRLFRFTAVDRTGRTVRDTLRAPNQRSAARTLTAEGLTPLSLEEQRPAAAETRQRALRFSDRVIILRQLSLMVEAGVGLLEAISTVAAGIEAQDTKAEFEQLSRALKRGESFGKAMEAQVPGFPDYVYAMVGVGEATGQLAEVLRDAAEQMDFEDRLRRDFANAMTYPAFLASAGAVAVLFIFTQVVPRFSVMIGDKRDKLPLISRWVIDTGEAANKHILLLLAVLGALGFGIVTALANKTLRLRLYTLARELPLVGGLLKSREIASWARLTGFALQNGVGLLEASDLARKAAPDGPFRRGLEQFARDLKAGVAVDQSLSRHTELTLMDLSLIRAGMKSGAMAKMLGFMADGYDAKLRDALKRLTALIEPIAIGLISILVGVVALSLILALSSVYDSVY